MVASGDGQARKKTMESRAPARGEIPVRGARNGNGARHTPTAGVGVVDDSSLRACLIFISKVSY